MTRNSHSSRTGQGIVNCRRCGKVFRRMANPLCPECAEETSQSFSRLYRYVIDHPNMTLAEIADHCGVPLRDAEAIFYEGGLGTASAGIILECHRCGVAMTPLNRHGRFCVACSDKVKEEARLDRPERPPERQEEPKNRKAAARTEEAMNDGVEAWLAGNGLLKPAAPETRVVETHGGKAHDKEAPYGFKHPSS